MARVKDKKKGSGMAKILIIAIIIIAIVGILFKFFVYDNLKEKAIDKVSENLIEQVLQKDGLPVDSQRVKQIIDSVSEEDKQKVEKIFNEEFGVTSIPKITEYVTNRDINGLKEYAKEKLSDDQLTELYQIYRKYQ